MRQRTTRRYRCAKAGDMPAEQLPPGERERLVRELTAEGWGTVAIAEHTRMSTYTTQRIRSRLQQHEGAR